MDGTRFGFREPKPVGAGYDTAYVLDARGDGPVAELHDAASGRVLTVTTTEPGLQLYTGGHFDGRPLRRAVVRAVRRDRAGDAALPRLPEPPGVPEHGTAAGRGVRVHDGIRVLGALTPNSRRTERCQHKRIKITGG